MSLIDQLIGKLYPLKDENGNVFATRTIKKVFEHSNTAAVSLMLTENSDHGLIYISYADAIKLLNDTTLKDLPNLDQKS